MHEAQQSKLLQCAVLLNRQYLLTDHLIRSRSRVLKTLERSIESKKTRLENVLDVFNYVFALIDNLVRFQKVASVLPHVSQRSPEFRAFASSMGDLKESRNQLQHINNDIENDNTGPLLGTICWSRGIKQYMTTFHDIGRERSSISIVFDTKERRHVKELVYIYNSTYYDLATAIDGVRKYAAFIEKSVSIEVGGRPYNAREHFAAISLEFRMPEQST